LKALFLEIFPFKDYSFYKMNPFCTASPNSVRRREEMAFLRRELGTIQKLKAEGTA